ncbi:MAG: hypothetical protein A2909_01540 [Candidatus Tagabacteria bacterium RIFCSPLOWO2_01_FULL_39_11]|uniref:Uncharacterized protein n=1 Tax=Candidatus Tagabacteria bacterium RIFCSPLOWO2_01_FULL_39_11 TaxID=1802295 RepID=A0A1G2LTD8_9BACT|nr:MAG: hypothetical protein A2909_01540 [Candidatus Tagabacteria bacterium RIFCSPLOWO2_01_FULL_39_11]
MAWYTVKNIKKHNFSKNRKPKNIILTSQNLGGANGIPRHFSKENDCNFQGFEARLKNEFHNTCFMYVL